MTTRKKRTQAEIDAEQVIASGQDTDAITGDDDTVTEDAGHSDQTSEDDVETTDSDDDTEPGNREARKYRRRAQAAEAERDALAEKLITLQRDIVAEMCARVNLDPRLLKANGVDLPDLCDDDGNLDREKVAAAIAAAHTEFRSPRRPRPVPQQGNFSPAVGKSSVKATVDKALGRT